MAISVDVGQVIVTRPTRTDIALSSAQNLQLFMLYGRLVDVGETFNRFADLGL